MDAEIKDMFKAILEAQQVSNAKLEGMEQRSKGTLGAGGATSGAS